MNTALHAAKQHVPQSSSTCAIVHYCSQAHGQHAGRQRNGQWPTGQRVRTRGALLRAAAENDHCNITSSRLHCRLRAVQLPNGRGRSGLGEPDERRALRANPRRTTSIRRHRSALRVNGAREARASWQVLAKLARSSTAAGERPLFSDPTRLRGGKPPALFLTQRAPNL